MELEKQKAKQTIKETNIANLPLFAKELSRTRKPIAMEYNGSAVSFLSGMPSTTGLDLMNYLLSKVPRNEDGSINGDKLRKRGIEFTFYEVCQALGIPNQFKDRKRIMEECERLSSIGIKFTKFFYKDSKSDQPTAIQHSVESPYKITIYTDIKDDSRPTFANVLYIHDRIIRNLETDFFRLADLKKSLMIDAPTAKLIWNLLSVHSHCKQWEIKLDKVAEYTGTPNNPKYKAKQTITRANEELKLHKLIKNYEFRESEEGETIIKYIFR